MDRAAKKELVTTLNGVFKDTNVVVVAHYTGLTVAQIAKRTGYDSQEAFSRAFKRRMCDAPTTWREKRTAT